MSGNCTSGGSLGGRATPRDGAGGGYVPLRGRLARPGEKRAREELDEDMDQPYLKKSRAYREKSDQSVLDDLPSAWLREEKVDSVPDSTTITVDVVRDTIKRDIDALSKKLIAFAYAARSDDLVIQVTVKPPIIDLFGPGGRGPARERLLTRIQAENMEELKQKIQEGEARRAAEMNPEELEKYNKQHVELMRQFGFRYPLGTTETPKSQPRGKTWLEIAKTSTRARASVSHRRAPETSDRDADVMVNGDRQSVAGSDQPVTNAERREIDHPISFGLSSLGSKWTRSLGSWWSFHQHWLQ